jgi:hypothetical protein
MKNCEKCSGQYEPYKVGPEEDINTTWCEIPDPNLETKGLCQFCNPKSKLYLSN